MKTTLEELRDRIEEEVADLNRYAGFERPVASIAIGRDSSSGLSVSVKSSPLAAASIAEAKSYRDLLVSVVSLAENVEREFEVESRAAEKARKNIISKCRSLVAADETGVAYLSDVVGWIVEELLCSCDVAKGSADEYTKTLIEYYVIFHPESGGGSNADIAASYCRQAVKGYNLSNCAPEALDRLREWVSVSALYPQRELDALIEAGVLE